jgi:LysM repeat protein
VTITDPSSAAMLCYTLDNSTPSATNGTLIANGGSVTISQSETLKVIAVESGWTSSGVVYAKYALVAAAPHLSIAGGTFHNPQAVTITESSPGATLYYTLDNSTPSATNGTPIASGGVVNITQNETLQVVAVANGWTPSGVVKARYTLTASAPHLSLAGGTYHGAQAVTITDASAGVQLVYTLDGTTPGATNGTAVSSGAVVNIAQTETLSVVAMESGWTSSSVVKANYIIK